MSPRRGQQFICFVYIVCGGVCRYVRDEGQLISPRSLCAAQTKKRARVLRPASISLPLSVFSCHAAAEIKSDECKLSLPPSFTFTVCLAAKCSPRNDSSQLPARPVLLQFNCAIRPHRNWSIATANRPSRTRRTKCLEAATCAPL